MQPGDDDETGDDGDEATELEQKEERSDLTPIEDLIPRFIPTADRPHTYDRN